MVWARLFPNFASNLAPLWLALSTRFPHSKRGLRILKKIFSCLQRFKSARKVSRRRLRFPLPVFLLGLTRFKGSPMNSLSGSSKQNPALLVQSQEGLRRKWRCGERCQCFRVQMPRFLALCRAFYAPGDSPSNISLE